MDAKAKGRAGMTSSRAVTVLTGLKSRLLEGLTPAEVKSLLATARIRRFAANSVITSEGDSADRVFLMLDGSARGYTVSPQGEKIVLRWVPPGETIGWAALLSKPMDYIVSTEAVKETSALVWDRATIRSFAATHPKLLENALLLAHDYLILYRILHEELANEANVTIFTVSRLMGEWQRKGFLTKSRGKVVLRLPEELIRLEA